MAIALAMLSDFVDRFGTFPTSNRARCRVSHHPSGSTKVRRGEPAVQQLLGQAQLNGTANARSLLGSCAQTANCQEISITAAVSRRTASADVATSGSAATGRRRCHR
ncbi:hypothetical protein AB0A74_22250 [Saccharothrix sp. NPDC042600]|uniref:hypothetical protein n=1 Tax=Saccharothrix TaxID=2071 RepID=UPI0033D0C83B